MTSAPHHPNAGHWQAITYFLAGLRRTGPALAAKTRADGHAIFNDCIPLAEQSLGDSLAVPVAAGQGACIS